MNIGEANTQLARRMAAIRLSGELLDIEPLMAAAQRSADIVRKNAVAAGDSIAVKIGRNNNNGIKIIVRGPNANKYRAILAAKLDETLPGATDLIKRQIVSHPS